MIPLKLAKWLAAVLFCVAVEAVENRPNILFVLSDDHSYPFLSCYGDGNVRTPAIDGLAAEGMKFHRFFTAAPQCVPSRAAFMTGRSPVAARITRFSSPLARDEITFPEILREKAGYFAGVCGRSYHLDGGARTGAMGELLTQNEMRTFEKRFDYVKTGSDVAAATQMGEFLDQKPAGKPFCLWVNFSDPHHPWNAPTEFRPDPAKLKLPAYWPDLPGVREQFADYCGEINRVDRSMKTILDLLAARGFASNTIVVFAGDNGAALPHGKGSLYDPGSNVPFIVRWPGVVKAGGESRALISGEDVAPTLLAAAGVAVPERMTGMSFLGLLKGQKFSARKQLFVERGPHGSVPVSTNMSSSGFDLSRAVRTDRYKYIYNCTPWIPYGPVDSMGGAAWAEMKAANAEGKLSRGHAATYFSAPRPVYELYDLEADPAELNNLAGNAEFAAVERELRMALADKMVKDFDYLPLPALPDPAGTTSAPAANNNNRAANFARLDKDGDGKLTKEEFTARREPAEAERWFLERDADGDKFISREEFVPRQPLPKKR